MSDLINQLREQLDDSSVVTDSESLEFYSQDIHYKDKTCLAVVRPQNTDHLQRLVVFCYEHKVAMFPRGGGLSYTGGYTPSSAQSIIIDTQSLDEIVEINAHDMYVTVQPGVSWEKLNNALTELGLRTPFWGPYSGIGATVGGSVSQHTVSHGSSLYGGSADSVVSVDVVTSNGEILSTGAAGHVNSEPFSRHTGPDLTGLFCGDCGAFGVKASITLRLIQAPTVKKGLSFQFDSFGNMVKGMAAVARAELADEGVGLDPILQQGLVARQSLKSTLQVALAVVTNAGNPITGLFRLLKLAYGSRAMAKQNGYSASFVVSGQNKSVVNARTSLLRELCSETGFELINTMPSITIAMPFAPLTNILGPVGERWVPIHGCLPFSRCEDFHAGWEAIQERHAPVLAEHNVFVAGMYSTVSTNTFLYEIAFYWPDARDRFHETVLDADHLKALTDFPAAPEGRAAVENLMKDAVELFSELGAVHFQIGRSYPFLSSRKPTSRAIHNSLKQQLDPENLFNPGVLGFDQNAS